MRLSHYQDTIKTKDKTSEDFSNLGKVLGKGQSLEEVLGEVLSLILKVERSH